MSDMNKNMSKKRPGAGTASPAAGTGSARRRSRSRAKKRTTLPGKAGRIPESDKVGRIPEPDRSREGKDSRKTGQMLVFQVILIVVLLAAIAFLGVLIWKSDRIPHLKSLVSKEQKDGSNSAQKDSKTGEDQSDSYDERYGKPIEISGSYVTAKDSDGWFIDGREDPDFAAPECQVPESALVKACEKRVNSQGSWILVEYCGIRVWVREDQLTWFSEENLYPEIRPDHPSFLVYVYPRTNNFKLRSSPEEKKDGSNVVVSGLTYGTELTVTEVKDGWGRVNYNGTDCWVDLSYCRTYFGSSWKVDDNHDIKLRSGPSEKSPVVMKEKIPRGSSLTISDFKDGFGRVVYDDKEGWVSLHFLTCQ